MPPLYLALHAGLCALCFLAARAMPRRRMNAFGVAALLIVVAGFAVERRPDWAWSAMALPGSGWIFLVNVSLEGVVVLLTLMVRSAAPGAANHGGTHALPWKTVLFGLPLVGAALWSYAWLYVPPPMGLHGKVDTTGYCAQTSDDSCSAAAAVMLLYKHGISTTEAEMARLCLTGAGQGTTPLGLFHGLWLKAATRHLRPRLVNVGGPTRLSKLGAPCIIAVGLKGNTPLAQRRRLEEYGWRPGVRHAVVIMHAEPTGHWADVADPSFGRERWPTADLNYIWDGHAVILTPQ